MEIKFRNGSVIELPEEAVEKLRALSWAERDAAAIEKAGGLTQDGLWNHNNSAIPSVVEVALAMALRALDGLWINHEREVHAGSPEERPPGCATCTALRAFTQKVEAL